METAKQLEIDWEIVSITVEGVDKISNDMNKFVESHHNGLDNWFIKSVKRLSDGEVFSIGNIVRHIYHNFYFMIDNFSINFNGTISANNNEKGSSIIKYLVKENSNIDIDSLKYNNKLDPHSTFKKYQLNK